MDGQPAVYLYIAAPEVNVLNCRIQRTRSDATCYLASVCCARPDSIQRPTVASGAVVVPASRDLDLLGYWIFGFTLSDEGQG
jgi:hypothetical protein